MVNVGDGALRRFDVEDPTRTHCHLAHIGALLASACHDGPHQVARLEAFDALWLPLAWCAGTRTRPCGTSVLSRAPSP